VDVDMGIIRVSKLLCAWDPQLVGSKQGHMEMIDDDDDVIIHGFVEMYHGYEYSTKPTAVSISISIWFPWVSLKIIINIISTILFIETTRQYHPSIIAASLFLLSHIT
jgi:hypothetical protein